MMCCSNTSSSAEAAVTTVTTITAAYCRFANQFDNQRYYLI